LITDVTSKLAGREGFIRDDNGVWMRGFVKNLGLTITFMAEMCGVYESLSMSRSRLS